MILKQYLRGSILMLSALIALSVIVAKAINQALTIVDKINTGEIPFEAGAITELVSKSSSGAEGSILNIAAMLSAHVGLSASSIPIDLESFKENN